MFQQVNSKTEDDVVQHNLIPSADRRPRRGDSLSFSLHLGNESRSLQLIVATYSR